MHKNGGWQWVQHQPLDRLSETLLRKLERSDIPLRFLGKDAEASDNNRY